MVSYIYLVKKLINAVDVIPQLRNLNNYVHGLTFSVSGSSIRLILELYCLRISLKWTSTAGYACSIKLIISVT